MSRRKQLKPYHMLGEGESQASTSHNDTGGMDTLLTQPNTDMTGSHGSCQEDGARNSQDSPCHGGCPSDNTGVSHATVNNNTSCSTHMSDVNSAATGHNTCSSMSVIQSPLPRHGESVEERATGAVKMGIREAGLNNGVVKEEPGLPSKVWGAELSPKSLALMRNICEYCGVVKKGPADLQRHLRKHTGERPFICQVCYKAFKAKRSLQYHEFAHHGVEPKDGKNSSRHTPNTFDKTRWPQKLSIAGRYGNNRDRIVTLDEAVALFTLSEMDKPGGPSRELNHKWLRMEAGGRSLQECSKSDSNNNDSLLSSNGSGVYKKCGDDGVTSRKRAYDDTGSHHDNEARDAGDDLDPLGLMAKRSRQTAVVARRSSRLAAKQHTSPSNHHITDSARSNHHDENGEAEKYYTCKVCAEMFTSATSLAIHEQVSHDTHQMASVDKHHSGEVVIDKESKTCRNAVKTECNASSCEEEQLLARSGAPADGDADGRGSSMQQQGSSGSSSSSSHRDSDITQNTSPPNFRSTGCYDDGSLPPGGSGDDNVIEYPSVFPGLKHRLSIKNETVLVTRLDGVDTTAGCQMSLFKCHMCGRMFRLLSRLQCHLSMHFERQLLLFQCTLCDSQFQFKMQLLQHLRSHGVRNAESPGEATDSPHTATAPCGQGLLSMVSPALSGGSDLQPSEVTDTPMATSDLKENQKDISGNKYLCHDATSGGLYACRYCWKTFDRYFCLQRHERVHTGFKPCCCRHCGKGFSESRNLRQHMMRFHNDLNPSQMIKRVRRKMSGSGLSRINQRLAYVTPEMIACASVPPTVSDTSTSEALYSQPFTAPADVSGEWGEESSFVPPSGPTQQPPGVSHLASEIRKKESLGDDVTVVIPSDVPLDDISTSHSRASDTALPWMMEDGNSNKESSPDVNPSVSSSDEIMSAPVKSILAYSQMKSSKRKSFAPTRGPASPEESPISVDTKTVDSWSPGSGGQPAVGLTSPAVTSSGVMDYVSQPMSAFSVSANAGSIPSVLPPRSDTLKADSTPPPLDNMSPSQFGLNFDDFDGDDDEMGGWLGRGHSRGTSLSRTHSRLNVVMSPLRREEVCKPTLLPDGRTVYRCTYCNKDFTTLSDINRHMDFHEGEYKDIRPYKCRFCDYFARTNSQLKVHMMRHQGIREFHCRLCNYKGVTQSDLNRHTKSQIHVMKAQNECEHCGEGFVSPKNLQQHYSEKHPALHQMAYSRGYNSL